MNLTTAYKGECKMRSLSTLKTTFANTTFSVTKVEPKLAADRGDGVTTNKSRTSWATVGLKADNGEETVINGLELIRQCIGNRPLTDAIFKKAPVASIVGDVMTIEKDGEFLPTFVLGFVNNRFQTGAVHAAK